MSDYIDRQVAIKDVYAIHTFDTEYDAALIDRLDVRYVLEDLPSADVEPVRHGRWIDAILPNDKDGLPIQVCNQCNTFFPLAYTGGGHRYCPNCGARMDGEQDG